MLLYGGTHRRTTSPLSQTAQVKTLAKAGCRQGDHLAHGLSDGNLMSFSSTLCVSC